MPLGIMDAVREVRLRTIVHKYLNENYQGESYLFLFERTTNEKAYHRYIKQGAPKEVNIPGTLRNKLDAQARLSQWAAMDDNMEAARRAIASMLNADVMPRFEASDEYKGYLASQDDTPAGRVAAALKLAPKPAAQVKGLLKVYNDARTPLDKYQAYEALIKLAGNETKLAAAFKAGGLKPLPALKKGNPEGSLKFFKDEAWFKNPKTKAPVLALLKKYNSGSTRSAREKVRQELIKVMTKHSLNGRETADLMLRYGGWTT